MKAKLGILGAWLVMAACTSGDPPSFESFEIWDGQPESAGATLVRPTADGTLTLRLDRLYTGRARLRTSGRGERCIYRIFSFSWNPPSRQFNCTPETAERQIIDEGIPTWRGDVSRVNEHRLTISVAEYDSASRSELNRFTPHTFNVTFQP